MDPIRDILRSSLSRSLGPARPEDRIAAAWSVACGPALAARGSIADYDPASATLRIDVANPVWLQQMLALRSTLTRDLARISGLPITTIEFQLDKNPAKPIFPPANARGPASG